MDEIRNSWKNDLKENTFKNEEALERLKCKK